MTPRDDVNLWPSITCDDAVQTRAWLVALGFTEGICVDGTAGTIMHSELLWPEGGRLMVSTRHAKDDTTFEVPRGSTSCYVVTADPDAVRARAQALDAEVIREMEETDYGSRGFSIADAEGNRYSFGTYAGS